MKEIREIIKVYDGLDGETIQCAMAQVVRVEGSSYRQIGARMLVTDMGTWTGGISGGCLEGDALKRAKRAILRKSASAVVYDTTKDDEYQIGVGLGCNGIIETLFIPLDLTAPDNSIENLRNLTERREVSILLTLLDSAGGPFKKGFSTIFPESPDFIERYPGLEEEINKVRKSSRSKVCTVEDLDHHPSRILIELIKPRVHLSIFGDNYDIYPFIRLANELGWRVDLYATLRKLRNDPVMDQIEIHPREEYSRLVIDPYTAVVLMNHDYAFDKKYLQFFLDKELSYLGVLGPVKRKKRMLDELGQEGFKWSNSSFDHLFSPSGLDLGAEGPEEIAISICAEIIAHFNRRPAGFLRQRDGAIHLR